MTVAPPSRSRRVLLGVAAAAVLALALAWAFWPRRDNTLRWGGDGTGGEPYIIEGADPRQPGGFEGDLARYLAGKLGRDGAFVQSDWDTLPAMLQTNKIDLVLNGYEWSAERESVMASSVPYYAYRLVLVVRKGSPIRRWSDLAAKRWKVGVLKDSAAHRYLERTYPNLDTVALGTEGTTEVMSRVEKGRFDATVQDAPVVLWYMGHKREYAGLHVPCEPVAPEPHSYYVIFFRPQDERLRLAVNEALRQGLADGSLRRIYEQYGLWDADQAQLASAADHWPPSEAAPRKGLPWFVATLAWAALTTVGLACVAMPLAMALGLALALLRLFGPRWAAPVCVFYVEVIRGTPVMLQLMVIYFCLPSLHVDLPAFWAGVLGLALNYAAYEAENYRAGLLAVPAGQMEAALALGMSRWTALRRVVVPQAVRLVVPPVTNDFISLFKDTSICSAIGATELMGRYRTLMVNYQSMALEVGLITAALYLLMSYPLSLLARRLERRSARRVS